MLLDALGKSPQFQVIAAPPAARYSPAHYPGDNPMLATFATFDPARPYPSADASRLAAVSEFYGTFYLAQWLGLPARDITSRMAAYQKQAQAIAKSSSRPSVPRSADQVRADAAVLSRATLASMPPELRSDITAELQALAADASAQARRLEKQQARIAKQITEARAVAARAALLLD
jgi:hypothetical protein